MGYTPVASNVQGEGLDPGSYASYRSESHTSRATDYDTNEKDSTVKGWPVEAQQVSRLTPVKVIFIVFDAILASAPLMFIVLAFIAARLNKKPVSDYGQRLEHTLLLSPTIFPIVFAALMGRCFKHIGLWRAERGITLGRLEQLVGCTSLFSALERLLSLRNFSMLGVLLTLVWLLSPLGGQSALRLLDVESQTVQSNGTVNYLNPDAFLDSLMDGSSDINSGRATFTSIYLAALLSSTKYQDTPMDLWGNVKMPSYQALSNPADSNGWKPVNYTQNVTYASLIGIPVANLEGKGRSSYTLKSRYFEIDCASTKVVGLDVFGNETSTMKFDYDYGACNDWPCPFGLLSMDENNNVTLANCSLSYQLVEAAISCNQLNCQANRIRNITDDLPSGEQAFTRGNFVYNSMFALPSVDQYDVGSPSARGSSNSEKWMYDPWDFIGATFTNVDLWKLPTDVLAQRLEIVFNTFWQSTYATTALGGNLPKNLTTLQRDSLYPHLTFNATNTHITKQAKDVYKTDWKWFSVLLVSSIILQIAAYTGLVLKYITLAPDILGYVSSLTLLNPYIPVPTGGTTLDGLERAALLHNIKIRIGDVCGNEPVGAIAVAKADTGMVTGLDRKRWYI